MHHCSFALPCLTVFALSWLMCSAEKKLTGLVLKKDPVLIRWLCRRDRKRCADNSPLSRHTYIRTQEQFPLLWSALHCSDDNRNLGPFVSRNSPGSCCQLGQIFKVRAVQHHFWISGDEAGAWRIRFSIPSNAPEKPNSSYRDNKQYAFMDASNGPD